MAEDNREATATVGPLAGQTGTTGDGRWQASDGNWYPAQEHPDAEHRAAWSTYRPFGATVAPDQLPIIAVQPTAADQTDVGRRSRRVVAVMTLAVVIVLFLLGFLLVNRFLG